MRRIFSAAFFILDYRAARWCCGYFLTANTRTTPLAGARQAAERACAGMSGGAGES
jgi:hypothetical protein